jgi:hypothetical protein
VEPEEAVEPGQAETSYDLVAPAAATPGRAVKGDDQRWGWKSHWKAGYNNKKGGPQLKEPQKGNGYNSFGIPDWFPFTEKCKQYSPESPSVTIKMVCAKTINFQLSYDPHLT